MTQILTWVTLKLYNLEHGANESLWVQYRKDYETGGAPLPARVGLT